MKEGKVSVIMACYNASPFIGQAIDSVLAQTFTDWELIIINDASTDNSLEVISTYTDPRIKLLQLNVNLGPGGARNKGIEIAQGQYLAFLDADDAWLENKLVLQLKLLKEKKAALCYSSYLLMDKNGVSMRKYIQAFEKINYQQMLRNNYIGCLTVVIDRNVTGDVQMPLRRKRQDWGLWIHILKKHNIAYGVTEPLAMYRLHSDAISRQKLQLLSANYSFYKEELGYGPSKAFTQMIKFLFSYFSYKISQTKKLG